MILVALVVLVVCPGAIRAADPTPTVMPDLPQVMKDCGDNLKDLIDKDKGTLLPLAEAMAKDQLFKPYSSSAYIHLNFRIAFEKARSQYHNYFECVFERVTADMLSAAGDDTKNMFMAQAPNLTKWMTPANACLPEQNLTELLKKGSPSNLVSPSLTVYNSYVEYLQALVDALVNLDNPPTNLSFEQFMIRVANLKSLVEDEIQNALVAMDTSFTALKEMRRAFTMHVHFQCMLQNLEVYRRSMQNLRGVVEMLPSTLWDASMNK
jgi:hypothetical protein